MAKKRDQHVFDRLRAGGVRRKLASVLAEADHGASKKGAAGAPRRRRRALPERAWETPSGPP